MISNFRHRDLWPVFRGATFEWFEDKVPRLAAALAFYTIFSLTPIVIISLAIADVFYTRDQALSGMLHQAQFLIGDQGIAAIRLLIENAPQQHQTTGAMFIGLATMIFAATGAFTELKDALNTIWEVQPKPGLGLVDMARSRALAFAMVLVIGFLLLVSLILSAALTAASDSLLYFMPERFYLLRTGEFVVSFAVITVLFALVFKALPDAKVEWQDVWVGAAVTSLLFAIGKTLFGLYLGHSTIGSSYGAAGSLVVVILWTYYSSLILLFGAEMTQVQSRLRGARIEPASIAIHLSEHSRIQQGMPHQEELERCCEEARRSDGIAAQLPSNQAAGGPKRTPTRIRSQGLLMALAALSIGWLLGRRRKTSGGVSDATKKTQQAGKQEVQEVEA